MKARRRTTRAGPSENRVDGAFHSALSLLLEAHQYARKLHRSIWDFAVEIRDLRAAGVPSSKLRWLVCRNCVQHAGEIAPRGTRRRAFRRGASLAFTDKSCFVLTETGVLWAQRIERQRARRLDSERSPGTAHPPCPQNSLPHWDGVGRELRVGGVLVKHFKEPAPIQETILVAFQEEGWPYRIDDPIPPRAGQETKRRLHAAINKLNGSQLRRLIRFRGDGTGTGIHWEMIVEAESDTRAEPERYYRLH